jgi:peptidoglycan/LPS O-acetylase OafA/YrhL
MKRFEAIEGLRGVLAWTVVVSHLVYFANIYTHGFGGRIAHLGRPAVLIFIIVSGFVITHVIIERPEPYRSYLTRRFMRIFPLFAVTSVIGYFACDLQVFTLTHVAYSGDPDFDFVPLVSGLASSNHQNLWLHILAHLTMLHGVISDDVLPFSAYAFNIPAWSISLEWQFYVLAPFILMVVMRRRLLVPAAIVLAAVEAAYRAGLFGHFYQPSFLPAASTYFAVGIVCRLVYPVVAGSTRYALGIAAVVTIMLLPIASVPTACVLLWMLVYLGLIVGQEGAPESLYARLHRTLWENPVLLYFGSRSYSIYLAHIPAIALCHFVWMNLKPMAGPLETFVALSMMTVPVLMAAAEVLYRGVERPGIELGARIARWLNRPSVPDRHLSGTPLTGDSIVSPHLIEAAWTVSRRQAHQARTTAH